LFERSAVFTRAAHALEAAADQLRQAHGRDFAKAAAEAQSASMVAMHAALSAHQLVGAYETAAWLESERERAKPTDR
jgi:carbohydrate-selective porin OprB